MCVVHDMKNPRGKSILTTSIFCTFSDRVSWVFLLPSFPCLPLLLIGFFRHVCVRKVIEIESLENLHGNMAKAVK